MKRKSKKVSARIKKIFSKKKVGGEINYKNREETNTAKMCGIGEDRRELQTLPGTWAFQGDFQTRKVGPNTLYETKASSKGNSGSSSNLWFSGMWISEATSTCSRSRLHRPCVSTTSSAFIS